MDPQPKHAPRQIHPAARAVVAFIQAVPWLFSAGLLVWAAVSLASGRLTEGFAALGAALLALSVVARVALFR
jgi:hypothetical protein